MRSGQHSIERYAHRPFGIDIRIVCAACVICYALCCRHGSSADPKSLSTVTLRRGALTATFRDNAQSPRLLSGIDQLFHDSAASFDAFDPDSPGASAGLNFEHIISGHASPYHRFTPRSGRFSLHGDPGQPTVRLVRRAEDSPWRVSGELTYTLCPPHYVDFQFRCKADEAERFADNIRKVHVTKVRRQSQTLDGLHEELPLLVQVN